jgi:hypothetical protein
MKEESPFQAPLPNLLCLATLSAYPFHEVGRLNALLNYCRNHKALPPQIVTESVVKFEVNWASVN